MQNEKKTVRRFVFKLFKVYWKRELLAAVLVGVMVALAVVFPLLIRLLIDVVIPSGNMDLLVKYVLLVVGLWFGSLIFTYFGEVVFETTALMAKSDLRKQLLEKMFVLPFDFFHKNKTGELVSRLISDLELVGTVIAQVFPILLLGVVQISAILAIMFAFNWKLTLLPLGFIVFSFLVIMLFNIMVEKRSKVEREKFGELAGVTSNIIDNMKLIRIAMPFAWVMNFFDRFQGDHVYAGKRFIKAIKIAGTLKTSINGLISFSLLAYGGYLVMKGEITVGILMTFWAYVQSLFNPIQLLMQVNILLRQSWGGLLRTIEVLEAPEEVSDSSPRLENVRSISLENIEFGYGKKQILKGLSLELKKGEITTLVGESGAGKTTTLNILMGLQRPQSGTIYINGDPVSNSASLRPYIGFVEQTPTLFERCTLLENITLGRSISEASLENIFERTNLDVLSRRFENGLDTLVADIQLSGGERQLVALARALVSKPQLLILDEITSNIDSKTEEIIQNTLLGLRSEGIIVLMVAHRLSTVLLSDRVALISNGVIVASGTHNELLKTSSEYKKLYSLQLIKDE
ncbi:ABC transporter ATP-binding protein [Mesotoga sp. UBA6090]|nr:ABC transporter ATP-binding protein [Mesotoga sp. UBA6090]